MSSYAPARIARSLGSRGTAPSASHETFCRMAVCTGQPAGIHTRPASRGTRRATAVKPRPSRMSPYTPARPWHAVWGQGHCPLRKPRDLLSSGGLYRPTSGNPHQTGEPRGLSPSGGKTPAKPNVFLRPCANSTQSGVKGHCPLRKPRDLLSSGGLYRPTSGKPHRTGEPWHPSCHGGKTPAKPNVSLHPCAPMARSPGSGVLPLKL